MHVNTVFIILTFIVIVAVVLVADTVQTAATIVSLIAGFFVITTHSRDLSRGLTLGIQNWGIPLSGTGSSDANTSATTDITGDADATAEAPTCQNTQLPGEFDQNTNLYGGKYESYHAYNASYGNCYREPRPVVVDSAAEAEMSVDAANCLITQKRARDKKCSDGWASKNADFYKYHYGNELEESEAKPWWGKFEL